MFVYGGPVMGISFGVMLQLENEKEGSSGDFNIKSTCFDDAPAITICFLSRLRKLTVSCTINSCR